MWRSRPVRNGTRPSCSARRSTTRTACSSTAGGRENITYLFGFRKHEQGNNAIEVPQFDPLVEAKEREIARLRKPVPHAYELIRVGEVAK